MSSQGSGWKGKDRFTPTGTWKKPREPYQGYAVRMQPGFKDPILREVKLTGPMFASFEEAKAWARRFRPAIVVDQWVRPPIGMEKGWMGVRVFTTGPEGAPIQEYEEPDIPVHHRRGMKGL